MVGERRCHLAIAGYMDNRDADAGALDYSIDVRNAAIVEDEDWCRPVGLHWANSVITLCWDGIFASVNVGDGRSVLAGLWGIAAGRFIKLLSCRGLALDKPEAEEA